jgi:hydroxysqualene synthase
VVTRADLAGAYACCERLARDHYENFPVASRLLPRRMRPHVAAVYAFARIADDFADEGNVPAAARLRALDRWGARLDAAVAGTHYFEEPNAEVFLAVASSIRECRLPLMLLHDLLSAFRQDVTNTRYDTWDQVLDYCRRSANPVGRLVLRIAGVEDDELDASSDALCTALQLTNFWQDLDVDWRRGRLYVPAETTRRTGAREEDLTLRRMTPGWRDALAEAAERTQALYARGRRVCDGVHGRLRLELRATWLGGRRVLSKLERSGFEVFDERPSLGAVDISGILWRALIWSGA